MDLQLSQPVQKPLTLFRLVMIIVLAIDSIKNLPANAQYGSSLLIYYLIAILCFFIPSALVTAELATGWPETGGVYVWVREAFNKRMAFLAVWIQWIYAIIWYPTILSFIAIMLTYLVNPQIAESKAYIVVTIVALFWIATFINCLGIRISSYISTLSAIIGVIVPMIFIMLLGIFWIYTGHSLQIAISPKLSDIHFNSDHLRLFITLLYSLMGIEIVAIHAGDVPNPKHGYPRALIIATFIIIVTVIPASLAIAIVIPPKEISLTGGVIESFIIFLNAFHLAWLKPFVVLALAIGSFGIFLVWLLAAARCLLSAANDHSLPVFLQKTNKNNMPIALLITQGIIFTFLSSAFVLMPSVSSAFWLLTASSSQLALIYYLFLFFAALRLRYKNPQIPRAFQIGKSPLVLWLLCSCAIATCFISLSFGFLPPAEIDSSHLLIYEATLTSLILFSCGTAWVIYDRCQQKGQIVVNSYS